MICTGPRRRCWTSSSNIARVSRGASILLLCMARPELLERRPSWNGGRSNTTTVLLEPLGATESAQLLTALGQAPEELHERIVEAAEGNPLFLEEMLALVRDSPDGHVEVPPTIQALLAARLDQLDPRPSERVLERWFHRGTTFHRGAVAALAEGGRRRSTTRCWPWCAKSSSAPTCRSSRGRPPTASGTS